MPPEISLCPAPPLRHADPGIAKDLLSHQVWYENRPLSTIPDVDAFLYFSDIALSSVHYIDPVFKYLAIILSASILI